MTFTKPEPRAVGVDHVAGVEIETDPFNRPAESWDRLDNFDQFVSGAIRKVRGLAPYGTGQTFTPPLQVIRNYRRRPSDPEQIIGMDGNGTLWDLVTGAQLTATLFSPDRRPWLGQMPGLTGGVSDPSNPSTPTPINVLVTTTPQNAEQPQKWDGIFTDWEDLGLSAPIEAMTLDFLITAAPPGDITKGFGIGTEPPLVSWQYVWTYWEPNTRHESSPSPLGPTLTPNSPVNVGALQGITGQPQIAQVRLHIPSTPPLIGNSATIRKRVYRTRDGGQTFFLLANIFGADADGSIPLAQEDVLDGLTWTLEVQNAFYEVLALETATSPATLNSYSVQDMVPDPAHETVTVFSLAHPSGSPPVVFTRWFTIQNFGATILDLGATSAADAQVPSQDADLVQPAPNPGDNDAPRPASWGTTYQGRIFFLDYATPNQLDYSEVVDSNGAPGFESFPPNNFFPLVTRDDDPVTALEGQYQQLIIGKRSSTDRLIGTDFTDFVVTPLDPQIGIVGRVCLANSEGALFFLSQQGVMLWQGDVPQFYGRAIRPYTDAIDPTSKFERTLACIDTIQGIGIMSLVNRIGARFRFDLILWDLSQASPWSRVFALPNEVTALAEVTDPATTNRIILVALADGRLYQLWTGDTFDPLGVAAPIVATAQTQGLPQDDPDTRKAFRDLMVQLDSYEGWSYRYGVVDVVDNTGTPVFTPFIPLQSNNPIGCVGKQIVIQFQHNVAANGTRPVLGNYEVSYTVIGEGR